MEERQPKALTAAQSMALRSAFSEEGRRGTAMRKEQQAVPFEEGNRRERRAHKALERKGRKLQYA